MPSAGDGIAGSTIYRKFTTRATTGVPTTLAGTPVVSIYKDGSTTESTTGVTLTVDYDSRTGLNHVAIDTSADTTFYVNGSYYVLVITTGTVSSVSVVGEVVGTFMLASGVVRSGLAQAGASGTITLDASASATDNLYRDQIVQIAAGTGSGQTRLILSYVGSTKVATITPNWATNPDSTSQFTLIPFSRVDLAAILGTVSAGTAGYAGIDWSAINAPTTTVALTNTTISAGQNVIATNTVNANLTTIAGQTANAAGAVTFPGTIASTTNITAGTIATVTNAVVLPANPPSGFLITASYGTAPAWYTSPTNLSGAAIATAIWQDTTSGDFTVASSIGKSLYTAGIVPGGSGGLFIAGTNAATSVTITGSLSGSVGSVTAAVTVGGYSASQDPATLVLDIAASSHNTAGTIGAKINAAGTAADPLANATSTYATPGTVGYVIGHSLSNTGATVNAYASGQDPATLVLDVAASGHNTSGTIGQKINAAGAAGDPWAVSLPGAYSSGTAGNIVGTNINATVSSRSTYAGGAVASVTGAVGSVTTPVTVGGYATGQDPAALVLDVAASLHNSAGTIGSKINSAAASGDPWSVSLPGSYANGTAGKILGTNLDAQVSTRSTFVAGGVVVLDLTQAVPTSNADNTVGDTLNAARAQAFGKWTLNLATKVYTLYAPNGTTVVKTLTYDSITQPTVRQ